MLLKIGLVTGEYPPMEGGVGAFSQELARALYSAGHEIHIITDRRARPTDDGRGLWDIYEPYRLPFGQLHPRLRNWRWGSMSIIADIAIRYDLDLVNIQYQAAAFSMNIPAVNFLPWRLKGIAPLVATFHDLRVPYLFPKAGRLRRWVVDHLARRARGAIVTNGADYRQLQKAGLPDNRLRQIPIGSNIDPHPVTEKEVQAVRRGLGLKGSQLLLGYFGFLNESKGADTLLQALARLPADSQLIFIGGQTGSSDPDNNRAFLDGLRGLIAQLGLSERVHWSGFLPETAVSAHLRAADIMVMPYRDGVSLRRGTLMAALAHGRPLITTRPAVPTPELVHGQNVYFVPVDDSAALTDAIRQVAGDGQLRSRLASGAAAVAGLFTWDKIAAQTVEFYHRLLAAD